MRCPHCGFEDPEDFAFCSECGKPRAGTPAGSFSPAPSYPPPPPPGAYSPQLPPTPAVRPAYGIMPSLGEGRTARLVGIEGPVDGQEFVLDQPEMGIGRR